MAGVMMGVKMEEDIKVKAEPDSPTGSADDIEDDDTDELQIPKDLPKQGWMIHVPKDLYAALDGLKDEDKIEIGEMRMWNTASGQKIRLQIRNNLKGFQLVPKHYDLTPERSAQGLQSKNTFVFTEKNLPGFRPNVLGRNRPDRPRVADTGTDRMGSPFRVDKNRSRGPRIIPKHTALYTFPNEEVRCTPRENEEWRRLQAMKLGLTEEVNVFSTIDARELHDVGAGRAKADQMQGFIVSNVPKKRVQENKAIRMPKQDLIRVLGEKFQQYKFWPLKSLKHETKQPEAFLKEVLSEIGYLAREGPAANKWGLKREFAQTLNVDFVTEGDVDADNIAKEEEFDDEEEEEDEMEDVKIEGR